MAETTITVEAELAGTREEREAAVARAVDAMARALGYAGASDPAYVASCAAEHAGRGFGHYFAHAEAADDLAWLDDLEARALESGILQRNSDAYALNTLDAAKWNGGDR